LLERAARVAGSPRVAALALVLAVAAADELHQAFSGARTGSPRDVVLDLAGGTGALLLVGALWRPERQATTP